MLLWFKRLFMTQTSDQVSARNHGSAAVLCNLKSAWFSFWLLRVQNVSGAAFPSVALRPMMKICMIMTSAWKVPLNTKSRWWFSNSFPNVFSWPHTVYGVKSLCSIIFILFVTLYLFIWLLFSSFYASRINVRDVYLYFVEQTWLFCSWWNWWKWIFCAWLWH